MQSVPRTRASSRSYTRRRHVETEALTQRISCIGPYAVHPSTDENFKSWRSFLGDTGPQHVSAAQRLPVRSNGQGAGGQVAGGTAGGLNILGCWAPRGLLLSRTAGADANHGKIRSSDRAGRAGAASRVIVIGCNGFRSAQDIFGRRQTR
jgi:hypothetical protein